MGWFEEQIRNRIQADRDDIDDVVLRLAGIIVGQQALAWFKADRLIAKNAIETILKYYHMEFDELPETLTGVGEMLDYLASETGLMYRNVTLHAGWRKNAFGAMLGSLKDTGELIPIMPGAMGGYYYVDSDSGKRIRVTRSSEKEIDLEAICFYKALPDKGLGLKDLAGFIFSGIRKVEWLWLAVYTLAGLAVGLMIAPLTSLIYQLIPNYEGLTPIFAILGFLLTLKVSQSLMDMLKDIAVKSISSRQEVTVQAAVMMRVLMLPASFFRAYSAGDLQSRIDLIPEFCKRLLSLTTTGIFSVSLSIAYLLQIAGFSPVLTIPVLLQIGLTALSSYQAVKAIGNNKRKILEYKAQENGYIYNALRRISKIRVTGTENRTFIRWAKMYYKVDEATFHPSLWIRLCGAVPTAISLTALCLIYYLAARTGISKTAYFGFAASYGAVTAMLSQITGSVEEYAAILPIFDMLKPLLSQTTENAGDRRMVANLSGNIRVQDVSFSYSKDGPRILNRLNLNIRAGEYVAITGRTGCGKSTLMRLLLGFETPQRGTIYYDRNMLDKLDLRSVRQQIGTVLQDGKLFIGDIYSNIVICNPSLSLDEAWEAAELAGISEDIRQMPMGMRTLISEENGGISGGQKQRLMIARAIANHPKILFFDEATSALDNISQKKVSESLDSLKCTRIVIAHRLSTIRNCDRILVMDQGNIVGDGSYEELLVSCPLFEELVKRQMLDAAE